MPSYKHLAIIVPGLFLLFLGSGPLDARTKKGDKLLGEGRIAEQRKEYDKALELYEQALNEDPGDSAYQMAAWRTHFQAAQKHVENGLKIRTAGKLPEALAEFEKAYAIDPSSTIAQQEIRRTIDMIEREKKKAAQPGAKEASPQEKGLTPAQAALKETERRIATEMSVPELKPLSRDPINLKIANQVPRVLYETVGKLAGINVVFDPDFLSQPAGRNMSLDLTNSSLEQALDYLSVLTKTFWKPLSPNAIFVTVDDVQRRRNFEEQVVKVFYVSNVTTAQEFNELATALRQVTGITSMLTYSGQNAIIVRAEADRVALCEKLIHDLDKPKPEVVIDVYVMELSSVKERDLSAGLNGGINSTIGFTPRNPVLTGGTTPPVTTPGTTPTTTPAAAASNLISLAQIGHVSTNDFSTSLPGALLEALLSDRNNRILQAPQLRAIDGQKSSIKIGDRVPYATGSFQPGIGTVGVSPLVSTQFQFLDTGVNVEITPKVNGADEVSLHVDIDISQVNDRIDLGGISEPVVGQRKGTLDVRLRDGEVSMISGLRQSQETKTISGVPILANIPILGRLFSSEIKTKNSSELLIALVPHLVRTQNITEMDLRGIASGTFANVKLSYAPKLPEPAPQGTPATQPPAGGMPLPASPVIPIPGTPGAAPGTPVPGTPAPAVPGVAAPSAPAIPPAAAPPPAAQAPPAAGPTVLLHPVSGQAQLGGAITVQLEVQNVTDLFAAPAKLKFDPNFLRLNEVTKGGFLAGDGKDIIFTRNILNDSGDATINLNRMPGNSGVSGSGTLLTFTFQAVARGTTKISSPSLTLRNSQSQPIVTTSPEVTIEIK